MKLSPTNQKVKPRDIFGFDIETKGKNNVFIMGSIVGKNGFKKVFWNKRNMQRYILNSHKLRGCFLFATNLNFDFTALFDNFKTYYKFQFILRNTAFISVKYKKKNYSLTMLDTLNFLKTSVHSLGKIIGIPKFEKPDFLGEDIILNDKQKKILEEYNIIDSTITYKFAELLQERFNNLGANMKYTIASTALALFKNKYLDCTIQQPNKEILKIMYYGYYGGRTETFYRGLISKSSHEDSKISVFNRNSKIKKKKLYYYDINSLYPFEMASKEYPNPNYLFTIENPSQSLIYKYEGLSYCHVSTENVKNIVRMYPFLPLKHDGKLLFPLGEFKGWYSHCELRKAIKLGYTIEIKKSYYYTKTFKIFSDYVTDLYNARLKNKGTKFEIVYKILMSSLYGKFAQKLQHAEILFPENIDIGLYHEVNIDCLQNDKPLKFKIDVPAGIEKIINGVHIETPLIYYITDMDIKKYPKFINPILSIYTTSYSRITLYEYIEYVYNHGGIIYYCDTDSLITNCPLKTGKELGNMKLELQIKNGILIKPKFYFLNGLNSKEFVKCKGLMNLDNKGFFKLLETGKYKYMKFTKFKESLRKKDNKNNPIFNQKMDITKYINFEDNKRIWKNDKIDFNILEKSIPKSVHLLED